MKRLVWLITGPVALLIIAFAIANRHDVVLSFDPFSLDHPALALRLPLWSIAFGSLLVGVVLGGMAAWITRAHRAIRNAARRRAEAKAAPPADALEGVPAISGKIDDTDAPMMHPPALAKRG